MKQIMGAECQQADLFPEARHFAEHGGYASARVGQGGIAFFDRPAAEGTEIVIAERVFSGDSFRLLRENHSGQNTRELECGLHVVRFAGAEGCGYVVFGCNAGYLGLLEASPEVLAELLSALVLLLVGDAAGALTVSERLISSTPAGSESTPECSLAHLLAAMSCMRFMDYTAEESSARAVEHVCIDFEAAFDPLYREVLERALSGYEGFVALSNPAERYLADLADPLELGDLKVPGMGLASLALARSAAARGDLKEARRRLLEAAGCGYADECAGVIIGALARSLCDFTYAVIQLTELLPNIEHADNFKATIIDPLSRLGFRGKIIEVPIGTGKTAPLMRVDRIPEDPDSPQYCYRLAEEAFDRALDAAFEKQGGYNPRDPSHVKFRRWAYSQTCCSGRNEDDVLITKELANALAFGDCELHHKRKSSQSKSIRRSQ